VRELIGRISRYRIFKIAQEAARSLLRRLVYKRRLPRVFARTPLYVTPDATLEYILPGRQCFDQDLLRVAHEYTRSDSIVWDIGANLGVFSLACASIATKGRVLAVEPDPWMASLIKKSAQLRANRSLTVDVLCAAISDRAGVASFHIAGAGRASNAMKETGGRTTMGGVRQEILVPTLRVDDLLAVYAPPALLKIDVEGAEALVLHGADQIINKVRPVIYIETGAETRDEVSAILTAAHYRMYEGSGRMMGQLISVASSNTLAVPQEDPSFPG